jgi:hypothetical protein
MDMRRARFGVMKYKTFGRGQWFDPIYRTGMYGNVRFVGKNGHRMAKDLITHQWISVEEGVTRTLGGPSQTFANHKKTKIGRSGLAKSVWKWAQVNTINGGRATLYGIPDIAFVNVHHTADTTSITIRNDLRYSYDAMQGGPKDSEEAVLRAAKSMQYLIDDKLRKATAYA